MYESEIAALEKLAAAERVDIRFGPAAELAWLHKQQAPAEIQAFYAAANPSRPVEAEGVFLLPVAKMIDHNMNVTPGIVVNPLGFVVLATTISGDAYAIDVQQAGNGEQTPVYLISHDRLGKGADREAVFRHSKRVTDSFKMFLNRFIQGKLPYDLMFVR